MKCQRLVSQNKNSGLALHGVSEQSVTHAALLDIATKKRWAGIKTEPVFAFCRPEKNFWVFKPWSISLPSAVVLSATATLIPAMSLP